MQINTYAHIIIFNKWNANRWEEKNPTNLKDVQRIL